MRVTLYHLKRAFIIEFLKGISTQGISTSLFDLLIKNENDPSSASPIV